MPSGQPLPLARHRPCARQTHRGASRRGRARERPERARDRPPEVVPGKFGGKSAAPATGAGPPTSTGRQCFGTLKSFNAANNYGFIECEEVSAEYGGDCFAHGRAFVDENIEVGQAGGGPGAVRENLGSAVEGVLQGAMTLMAGGPLVDTFLFSEGTPKHSVGRTSKRKVRQLSIFSTS